MDKQIRELIFDEVLEANSKYTELIGTPAEGLMLELCSNMFENLILKTGLVNEYSAYCERKKVMEASSQSKSKRKCEECPYFKILQEPLGKGEALLDWGMAKCEKYDLITDFRSHRKIQELTCIV